MAQWQYLDLIDILIVAEAVLQMPMDRLLEETNLPLARSALDAPHAHWDEYEFYTLPQEKAAALLCYIIRTRPFPYGNRQVALIATLEFLERNSYQWQPPPSDTASWLNKVGAREIGEREIAAWIYERLRQADTS